MGISSSFPTSLYHCTAAAQRPLRAPSSSFWQICGIFHTFKRKRCITVYIYNKLKKQFLKTVSRSSPNTEQSNNITLSQFQSCATVPLKQRPLIRSVNEISRRIVMRPKVQKCIYKLLKKLSFSRGQHFKNKTQGLVILYWFLD